MRSSPTANRKPFRAPRITFWVLFSLAAGLTIAESFVPSGKSGKQSDFLSMILSAFINDTMPAKEVQPIGPTSISFSPDTRFVGGDKAVVGTTKLISYSLAFENKEGTVKDGAVKLTFTESPSSDSFTYVHTPISAERGAIRITPLVEGKYSFALTDNYGKSASFSLNAVARLEPESLLFPSEAMELDMGGIANVGYSLESDFYSLPESDAQYSELVDHYLQRFYDPALTSWSSSDESVCTIDEYGFVKGVGFGNANIMWKGKTVREVHVSAVPAPSSPFTISLEETNPLVHPLDYDYYNGAERYGVQLTPTFSDGNSHPVHWISSDPLVAMVNNEHIEYDHEGVAQKVAGGFVAGYRKAGKVTITAVAVEDPSIKASIEFDCQQVPPSSFAVTATSQGKKMSVEEVNELNAGSVISFAGSFLPKNSSNQVLKLEVSDSEVASIGNNLTSAPTVLLNKDGDVDVSVSCPYIENSETVTIRFKSIPLPYISPSDMPDFKNLVRKGLGHFTLFAGNGVFFMLAMSFTFFLDRAWGVGANYGISLVAGFSLGGLSELIQAIPVLKRGSTMTDVLIDSMGFAAGAAVVAIVFLIILLIKGINRRSRLGSV